MHWTNVEDGMPEFEEDVLVRILANNYIDVYAEGKYTDRGWVIQGIPEDYTVLAWAKAGG